MGAMGKESLSQERLNMDDKKLEDLSWIWRSTLRHRDLIKPKLKYYLGTGEETYFWLDPWMNGEAIWNIIRDDSNTFIGENRMAKVSDYWEELTWKSCPFNEVPSIRCIWDEIARFSWQPSNQMDRIFWVKDNGNQVQFSIKEGWKSVRIKGPPMPWHKALWYPSNIPNHSIVSWRACLNALPTADQLERRNIIIHSLCCLCQNGRDCVRHLFFECAFSKFIWIKCISMCRIRSLLTGTCIIEAAKLASIKSKGNSLSSIPKIVFNCLIYHIWKERNSRIFSGKSRTKEGVTKAIIREVEDKIISISFARPANPEECFIAANWNIDVH